MRWEIKFETTRDSTTVVSMTGDLYLIRGRAIFHNDRSANSIGKALANDLERVIGDTVIMIEEETNGS